MQKKNKILLAVTLLFLLTFLGFWYFLVDDKPTFFAHEINISEYTVYTYTTNAGWGKTETITIHKDGTVLIETGGGMGDGGTSSQSGTVDQNALDELTLILSANVGRLRNDESYLLIPDSSYTKITLQGPNVPPITATQGTGDDLTPAFKEIAQIFNQISKNISY